VFFSEHSVETTDFAGSSVTYRHQW